MWPTPSHDKSFKDIIIAVDLHGTASVVGGHNAWELEKCLGDLPINEYFGYEDGKDDRLGFPDRPGIYRCTVDFWFQQGYFEGYACDSESDWGISARDVKRIEIPDDDRFPWYKFPRG